MDTVKILGNFSNNTLWEISLLSSSVMKVYGDPTLLTVPKLMVVFVVLVSNICKFINLSALTYKSKFAPNLKDATLI